MPCRPGSVFLVVAPWLCCLSAGLGQPPPLSPEQLREQRRQLAFRPRRIIYNNDGCDALYFPKAKPLTVEGFLAERTSAIAGSQVGAIAYCTISSGFSNFTHRTRLGTILNGPPPPDTGAQAINLTQTLIDLGTDPLACVVDFCHEHGLEAFWSMRMNDTHDVEHRPDRPYFLYPPLKVGHPEWLVGDVARPTPYGRWSSVDYARPEIRDLAFAFIDEVCRNYDVDGIELDFFRHLCYFRSVAHGGVATDAEREAMTDLFRRVRAMTEEVGLQRGRPVLVAVRVPDSTGFCRDLGLDLERWLRDGLLDILITTCYFQLNPWEYSVGLGHRYGVAVYPCLSDSRVTGETRFRRGSLESYRGRAQVAWAAGADGIHVFNSFNPRAALWSELGDPATLFAKNKLYFHTDRDGSADSWLRDGERYRATPRLTPAHSQSLNPDAPLVLKLPVGEDVTAAREKGAAAVLHLEMPSVQRPDQVRVTFGGVLLQPTLHEGWLDCPVPIDALHPGANRIELVAEPAPAGQDEWGASWTADAKPTSPWVRDPGSPRTEERLQDGALWIADRGTESGDYLHYRCAWAVTPDHLAVLEARVKVVSGCSFLIVSTATAHERLCLWPDRIELYTDRSKRFDLDTTGDFHVYRIEIRGQDLRVLVDGQLRIDHPGGFTSSQRYPSQVSFGAANSGMVGEAWWQAVRCSSAGHILRDLVLSVSYPQDQ